MKRFEVILKDGTIGMYFGKKKPSEGEHVKVHVGNGEFVKGFVYDVIG